MIATHHTIDQTVHTLRPKFEMPQQELVKSFLKALPYEKKCVE